MFSESHILYSFEPVIPENLEQPILQLPFESGVDWAFTGGPHGGWGDGAGMVRR